MTWTSLAISDPTLIIDKIDRIILKYQNFLIFMKFSWEMLKCSSGDIPVKDVKYYVFAYNTLT